jgi:ribose transport system substrate-binding protein
MPMARPAAARAAGAPTLVNSIRSLSNPYHATWNQGGQAFAKSVGADYVVLVTEGSSQKGIADIRAILAKTGGNMVLNLDANDSADTRPIVEACQEAKAHVLTQWSKSADLHPWDHDPYYVAHISYDNLKYGEGTGNALIAAMGGKGGIVALGGQIANSTSIERKQGLDKALAAHPDVHLLDFQAADWQSIKAHDTVSAWLTRFGSDITGGASRRGPCGKDPCLRHRRHQDRSRRDPRGRTRDHGVMGPVLAGRHGPFHPLSCPNGNIRSHKGAARPP